MILRVLTSRPPDRFESFLATRLIYQGFNKSSCGNALAPWHPGRSGGNLVVKVLETPSLKPPFGKLSRLCRKSLTFNFPETNITRLWLQNHAMFTWIPTISSPSAIRPGILPNGIDFLLFCPQIVKPTKKDRKWWGLWLLFITFVSRSPVHDLNVTHEGVQSTRALKDEHMETRHFK